MYGEGWRSAAGTRGLLSECGCSGEVVGGDFGELLFDEDEGAEVEALNLGAGLHVVAGDGSAESGDEGLRVDGVVGDGLGVGVGHGWLGGPAGSLGRGRILVSRLKRTREALAARAAASGWVLPGPLL